MIYVSILNYRNPVATAECVLGLLSQSAATQMRVIVRDQSAESEVDMIRGLLASKGLTLDERWCRLFHADQNLGFGIGHNRNFSLLQSGLFGFVPAASDVFVIANNDISFPDPSLFACISDAIHPRVIASCNIETPAGAVWFAGGRFGTVTGDLLVERSQFSERTLLSEFLSGCLLACTIQTFRRVGGFDESIFMYAEDIDFSLRARRASLELLVLPNRVVHEVGSGEKGVYSDLYLYENTKNRIKMLRRYGLGWPVLSHVYFVMKYGCGRLVQLWFKSDRWRIQAGQVYQGFVDGYREGSGGEYRDL